MCSNCLKLSISKDFVKIIFQKINKRQVYKNKIEIFCLIVVPDSGPVIFGLFSKQTYFRSLDFVRQQHVCLTTARNLQLKMSFEQHHLNDTSRNSTFRAKALHQAFASKCQILLVSFCVVLTALPHKILAPVVYVN